MQCESEVYMAFVIEIESYVRLSPLLLRYSLSFFKFLFS